MTRGGRPLRFLALVLSGWIGARVAILWPQTGSLPEAIRQAVPIAASETRRVAPIAVARPNPARAPIFPPKPPVNPIARPPIAAPVAAIGADSARVQMALLAMTHFGAAVATGPAQAAPQPSTPWLPGRLPADPVGWSASAWLVARPGNGIGAAPLAGQLGGSQAGARIAYMLLSRQRLAGVARVVIPLKGRGAEASVGIEWQPARVPIRLVAEHRFGLDGTRGGWGAGVVAGVDTGLPADFRLEGYGQAGVVRRVRSEPYADGAIRVTRPAAAEGPLTLSLGAGAWGAAQRDAARLDIGPSATLSVRGIRVALDWRQRIAGDARPGSGPALSLGTDF